MDVGFFELFVDKGVLVADFADLSEDDSAVLDQQEVAVPAPEGGFFRGHYQELVPGLEVKELDDFGDEVVGVVAFLVLFADEFRNSGFRDEFLDLLT